MSSARKIEIVDVTARDGLQNESVMFSTAEKIDLIQQAMAAGARRLEIASFVHPKYVPQMADSEAVIAGLPKQNGTTFIGLVLNERGVERALKTDIEELGFVVVASDGFGKKNQNQTSEESVREAVRLIKLVKAEGRSTNVTISTAFGCPFDGEVESLKVVEISQALAESSPREIAVADTIGVGNPWHVQVLVSAIRERLPNMPLRAHFHNTRNTGIANAFAAIEAGVSTLDVSIGGIGGCPFAPGATGNIPAEDLIYMLERGGVSTGLDQAKLIETAKWLEKKMKKTNPGMLSRAGMFPSSVI